MRTSKNLLALLRETFPSADVRPRLDNHHNRRWGLVFDQTFTHSVEFGQVAGIDGWICSVDKHWARGATPAEALYAVVRQISWSNAT